MNNHKTLRTQDRLATSSNIRVTLLAIIVSIITLVGQSSLALASAASDVPTNIDAVAVTSYADMVSRVTPAVVTIRSEIRARSRRGEEPQFPFNIPGMPQEPRSPRGSGLGSGVIVTADGYILTNHHVVDDADAIKVELTDNRTFDAKVVGTDKPSDLAVLKINANNLPVLPLGDSDRVRVGDVVLAIGNPLGIGQTVTSGIISAKGRSTGLGDGSYEDFLQTDAAINRGNSGGALVNTNGELIGINSQILSPSGGNIGIGFAIPSNMARSVMDQLIKAGKVRRGQLGIVVQKISADIAASLGLREARGVIVSQVQAGSAAERAGIRAGDVITSLNGAVVNDPNTFRNQVAGTPPGTEVVLTIQRNGQEQKVRANLGEFSASKAGGEEGGSNRRDAERSDTGKLGLSVEPLTPEIASQLGLRSGTQGLVVSGIDPAGPAADAGIQRGDVIEQVNQQPVRTLAELEAALQRSGSRPALLLVNRRGTTIFVAVTPGQSKN